MDVAAVILQSIYDIHDFISKYVEKLSLTLRL
jgi:hypothetical protein